VYNKATAHRKYTMSFKLTYEKVARAPNPMVKINPLKRGTGKIVSLQDRVDTLNKSAEWKATLKKWKKKATVVDLSRLPKVSMQKLGNLWIDEDIQRALDVKHCSKKIADPDNFDPALLQTIQCIKRSDGKFISIDSQHTASVIAALIDAGLVPGHTDWKEFEFPFQYIETDNLSYARKAFGVLNGKGKKPQSKYVELRNSVFVIRIDHDDSDEDDVKLEKKVSIVEKHHCFPVEEDSQLSKYPGTFSNIATFKTLTDEELETACSWHNKYFHYNEAHVSLFFIFRDMCREFDSAKLTVTTKLQQELAALIQSLFANLTQFAESCKEAHRRWSVKTYGYETNWSDDAYAVSLVQLYQKFGGKERIPLGMIDRYDDLIKFFDEDILSIA
jgi:hypothetical protein